MKPHTKRLRYDPAKFEKFDVAEYVMDQAQELVRSISAEELAGINAREPKAVYTHASYSGKRPKGGSPPIDYSGVEEYVTLKEELDRDDPDLQTVATSYLRLQSLTGYKPERIPFKGFGD